MQSLFCCRKKMKNTDIYIHDSILDLVGNTPLVKLNKIPKDHGVECEIYVKCEFMNPSGSIKDRIALEMFRDAQNNNLIHENTTLVEPTSGNTGIGIAFNCALLGNKCTIVTEYKNSSEKVNMIRLLGADVIQVKNNEEEMRVAHGLRNDYADHIMLNQFDNHINPKTHYEKTGTEIVNALDNIDMVVMGAGTGGTLTGAGAKIKEHYPDCKIVAAEPLGSTMFHEYSKAHDFLVEGIGGTWIPTVLDKSIVDDIELANDEESFLMARELVRKEGMLCGGSSGTAMVCALKAIKRLNLKSGKKVVVILPDGIRNYMSKFVSDQWMESKLFLDPAHQTMSWWTHPITVLPLEQKYPRVKNNYTCAQALNYMKNKHNFAIVVNDHGWFLGVISKDSIRNEATNPTKLPGQKSENFNYDDLVTEHLVIHVHTLAKNGRKGMPTVGRLSRILDITPFVVIGTFSHNHENFIGENIVTGDNVLDYIYANSD